MTRKERLLLLFKMVHEALFDLHGVMNMLVDVQEEIEKMVDDNSMIHELDVFTGGKNERDRS